MMEACGRGIGRRRGGGCCACSAGSSAPAKSDKTSPSRSPRPGPGRAPGINDHRSRTWAHQAHPRRQQVCRRRPSERTKETPRKRKELARAMDPRHLGSSGPSSSLLGCCCCASCAACVVDSTAGRAGRIALFSCDKNLSFLTRVNFGFFKHYPIMI